MIVVTQTTTTTVSPVLQTHSMITDESTKSGLTSVFENVRLIDESSLKCSSAQKLSYQTKRISLSPIVRDEVKEAHLNILLYYIYIWQFFFSLRAKHAECKSWRLY